MIDLHKSPVVRILIPLVTGALAGYQIDHVWIWQNGLLIILCFFLWILQFVIFELCRTGKGATQGLFSAITFLLISSIGFTTGRISCPLDPHLPLTEDVTILGHIKQGPELKGKNLVFDLETSFVASRDTVYVTRTLIKVYLTLTEPQRFDSLALYPGDGETLQVSGRLVAIKNNGNPREFDYAGMMQRRGCWYRLYSVNESNIRQENTMAPEPKDLVRRLSSLAIDFRNSITGRWIGDPDDISLLSAVCLGDRSGLTDDQRQSFAEAGGMHLLAVSGLHIGLIWLVLNQVLAWTVRLFRKEFPRALVIVALLWFYASVTGFSSSVCRSVTMFTFFSLSRLMQQQSNTLNGIFVSAFVLIVVNPGRLFDVGFQLSYAAITGIVSLQPILRRQLRPKNRVLKWIWEASGVSLSAQISTMPLVIYYFHQIPSYALLTNLVAIPLLSGLIALFLFSIPLLALGVFVHQVNWLLCGLAGIMNRIMSLVGSLPGAVIRNLYLDQFTLYFLIFSLILITLILRNRSGFNYLFLLLLTVISLCGFSIRKYSNVLSSEVVVANFTGGTLISIREGLQVDHYIWARDERTGLYIENYIMNAWRGRGCRISKINLGEDHCGNTCGNVSISLTVDKGALILNSASFQVLIFMGSCDIGRTRAAVRHLAGLPADIILLSNEPNILPELKSIQESNPGEIEGNQWIMDGSNRFWYRNQINSEWPDSIRPAIHSTRILGAYSMRK